MSWRICLGFVRYSRFIVGISLSIILHFRCLFICWRVSLSKCLSAHGSGSLEYIFLLLVFLYFHSFVQTGPVIALFVHPNLCKKIGTFKLSLILLAIFILSTKDLLNFFIHLFDNFILLKRMKICQWFFILLKFLLQILYLFSFL